MTYLKGLILKVSSRCNLNCSYCYMYNLGDFTYRNQPKSMPNSIIEAILSEVARYCKTYDLTNFEFIFHGGEPLLLPKEFYSNFIEKAIKTLPITVKPIFSLQTNGTLLDADWCEFLSRKKILLGISLDGNKAINDLHRLTHTGRSSFDATMRGIKSAAFHKNPVGLLSVLTLESNPTELYGFYKSLNIKQLDFLWPHHTYDFPPNNKGFGETPYADWWIELFDIWYNDEDYEKPNIRYLTQVIINILGLNTGFDMLGTATNDYLVIETDGSVETVDALKICGNGFTKEGLHISQNSFEDALDASLVKLYHEAHKSLPIQCQQCSIVEICGGGFLPHRFSTERGFDNPSIYCADILNIIRHIQNRVIDNLSPETLSECQIEPITQTDIKQFFY
jgi:uncharacterized protein